MPLPRILAGCRAATPETDMAIAFVIPNSTWDDG